MKVDFEQIIYQAQANKALCVAWYYFNDQVIRAEVKLATVKKDRNELTFNVHPGSRKYVEEIVSGSGKVNIYIEEDALLFCSELKSYDDTEGTLIVGMPERYKFFDRRDKDRVDGPEDVFLEMEINQKMISKRCLDISSGGCSIVLSQGEDTNYKINDGMEFGVKLTFGDSSIKLLATVIKKLKLTPYKYENCPYGGARISLKFKDIDEITQQKIKRYILANQEFIKKL